MLRAERDSPLSLACFLLLLGGCDGETHSLGLGPLVVDGGMSPPQVKEPVPLTALTSEGAKDDDPWLTTDLTVLYFNSTRAGGPGKEDIWFATRERADDPWSAPLPANELNGETRETGIALSSDGLTIWFSSDRDGDLDVYSATRPTRRAPFDSPSKVSSLSSDGDDLISAVDEAQRVAYLARRAGEEDDYDLFVATRESASESWGEASPLAELNTDDDESDAFPLAGGSTLLFTRDGDLYRAARELGTGSYRSADALSALNSEDDDRDLWSSEDGSYLIFSSDRSGAQLLYELAP